MLPGLGVIGPLGAAGEVDTTPLGRRVTLPAVPNGQVTPRFQCWPNAVGWTLPRAHRGVLPLNPTPDLPLLR